MSKTDAEKKAQKKYITEKVDTIIVRVPKGNKEKLQAYAKKKGTSVNSLICKWIDEKINHG